MADCCSVKNASSTSESCAVKGPQEQAPAVMACPESWTRSKKVDLLTVKSLVRHMPFGMPVAQYYYCDAPGCDLVYFSSDSEAPLFRRRDLLVRVGQKEEHDPIPVCYCFGVARSDIVGEIRLTRKSTIAERIKAEVKAGHCACEVKNPSGKCCLGDVMRAVKEAQTVEIQGGTTH